MDMGEDDSKECHPNIFFAGGFGDGLRGARKSLPTARIYHVGSKVVNSRPITRNDFRSAEEVSSVFQSNILNVNIFPVASTSVQNNVIDSETDLKAVETDIKNAEDSDGETTNQGLFESTYKEASHEFLSSRSKTNSSGNKENIYYKRPLGSKDFQNIDSNKAFVKNFSEPETYECALRNEISREQDRKGHVKSAFTAVSIPGDLPPNRKVFVVNAVLSQPKILQKQNTVDFANKNPGFSEKGEFSESVDISKRVESKSLKSVRFDRKENTRPQDGNKTYFYDPNAPVGNRRLEKTREIHERETHVDRQNSIKGIMKRNNITSGSNISGLSATGHIGNRSVSECRVPHSLGVKRMNFQQVRPMYCLLPPASRYPCKNVFISPNYGIQRAPSYRMLGTATRGNELSEIDQSKHNASVSSSLQASRYQESGIRSESYAYASKPIRVATQVTTEPLGVQYRMNFLQPQPNEKFINVFQGERTGGKTSEDVSNLNGADSLRELARQTVREDSYDTTAVEINQEPQNQPPKSRTKLQEAEDNLLKLSETLHDIHKALSDGFECPGLENSLYIWKLELESCMLSLEKIKNILCEIKSKKK